MQLLAAAPSSPPSFLAYTTPFLSLLQRIVDRATRTSSNQICFMTMATTQNDAQTQHIHKCPVRVCVCVTHDPKLEKLFTCCFCCCSHQLQLQSSWQGCGNGCMPPVYARACNTVRLLLLLRLFLLLSLHR